MNEFNVWCLQHRNTCCLNTENCYGIQLLDWHTVSPHQPKTKPVYEGRWQSSWTYLITPSRNFAEMLWRSLFRSISLGKRCTSYNVLSTSRKRAADRWQLRNFMPGSFIFVVGKSKKSHLVRSELNSVFCLEKLNRWNPIRTSVIQSKYRPVRFLSFSNQKKGASRQEISKWSTVCCICRTFSRSGWRVVRSASLAKVGTLKWGRHRTSTKFRLGVIRWVHEFSNGPRT
jgi:hypothetical protein